MILWMARLIVRLAFALLPSPLRGWGRAMEAETAAIGRPLPALRFALGCLGGALREALQFHLLRPDEQETRSPSRPELPAMPSSNSLLDRPRHLAALCAVAATGLGFAYLAAAGAPLRHLVMNGGALALGLLLLVALAWTRPLGQAGRGVAGLALAAALLFVSLLGLSAGGVTRWVSLGGVLLQPGLFLLPLLALMFVRARDGLSLPAVLVAALAVALQPDRAMAGALVAGMAAFALVRPLRIALIALGAAATAFAVTLVRADPSQAMPFVDQIFYSSFAVHPLAGVAVALGAALMLVPALVGYARDPQGRASYAAFGAVWLAAIIAAALGNYPTPLVGYGGSAILGYLLSVTGLPPRTGLGVPAGSDPDAVEADNGRGPQLCAALPASA